MKRFYLSVLFLCSFGSLFAGGPSFAFCDYSQGKVFIQENGEIVWEHKAPDSNDIWVLPNKNILFPLSKGKAANTISPNTTNITLLVNLKAFISFSVSL